MNTYKIAVIGGDGIGPEVLAEGIKALNAAATLDGGFRFDFTYYPWGCDYYLKTGRMMPAFYTIMNKPYAMSDHNKQ